MENMWMHAQTHTSDFTPKICLSVTCQYKTVNRFSVLNLHILLCFGLWGQPVNNVKLIKPVKFAFSNEINFELQAALHNSRFTLN